MKDVIRPKAGTPAYLQMYQALVRDITGGVYPHGARLPSKRSLASEAGVSVVTAEHALGLLVDEGYLEAKERSGFYVAYTETDFAGDSATGSGTPAPAMQQIPHRKGDFPYTVLAKTMRRVLVACGDRLLIKSPNLGCPELRKEICLYLARSRNIHVGPSQIIIGSGVEYLYGLVAQLIGQGGTVAVEKPCYDKIEKVYRSMGLSVEPLTLTKEGISSKELALTRASVLHVTPFHSFPSGITVGISKKREYIRWANERGGILIEDNYDSEIAVSGKVEETLFSLGRGGCVFYLNSFSKTIAPSMRIGYMILPENMVETYEERLGFYSCPVPLFEQYVLAELLRNGDFERHIRRIRRRRKMTGNELR